MKKVERALGWMALMALRSMAEGMELGVEAAFVCLVAFPGKCILISLS